MRWKNCSKCGIKKELSPEYYNKNKTSKSGFRSRCKLCERQGEKKSKGIYMTTDTDKVLIPLTKGFVTVIDKCDCDLGDCSWWPVNFIDGLPQYASNTKHVQGVRVRRLLHREVMARILGRELDQSEFVDHIDGNTLNNTRTNLRIATCSQNAYNRKKSTANTSGYKGVSMTTDGKWQASINVERSFVYLGVYETPEEAKESYRTAALKLHGEFARFE